MLCFNYVANIMKFWICWDDGHVGICGGYAGRTTSPKSARPGCRFWTSPPPIHKGWGNRNGKRSASQKKNAYFVFNLLIINHINQYFNIHLHLIRFITYNRRIFIAKYLFENKTCSIFVYVKITLTNRRTRSLYKSRGYGQI